MGIIGFTDDYLKIKKKNKEGLAGKFKVIGQVGLGLIIGCTMYFHEDIIVRQEREFLRIRQKSRFQKKINLILNRQ